MPYVGNLVGRETTSDFRGENREDARWVGKPWRRLDLFVWETFRKGERVDRSWEASVNLGSRRLGFNLRLALTRQVGMDYSEEAP